MDIDTKYKIVTTVQSFITIGKVTRPNPLRDIYFGRFVWPSTLYKHKGNDNMLKELLENIELYEGPSDAYDYGKMNFKYQQIHETLGQFNTRMDYAWYSKDNHNSKKLLMKSDDNNFVWYLNQNINPNHKFYVGGKSVKIMKWLDMSLEERQELYDKYVS